MQIQYSIGGHTERKSHFGFSFFLSTSIKGEIFIQAVAEALHELFQNVKDLLERFRTVELNLDVLSCDPPKTGIKSKCFWFFPYYHQFMLCLLD